MIINCTFGGDRVLCSNRYFRVSLCTFSLLILTALFSFAFPFSITASAQQPQASVSSWSELQKAIDNASSGDTIALSADVTAGEKDTSLIIPNGKMLTLDLNGHTVDRALKEHKGNEGTAFFVRSGAMLTVTDTSKNATGKITGGYSTHGGGINNTGAVILEGGCITGNTAKDSGGGIANYGDLVIKGGSVTANTSLTRGGGVLNDVKGYMTVDEALIYGNKAPEDTEIYNLGSVKAIGGETVDITAVKSTVDLVTILPAMVLVIVLFFAVFLDNYLERDQKRIMYAISILVFTLILQNYLDTWVYVSGKSILFRTVVSIYGYAVRPAILALFLHIIKPGGNYKPVWAAVCINAGIYLTALFSPLAFSFSSFGHFKSGPLNPSCLVVSVLLFLYCLYLTFSVFRPKEKKETWLPVLALVLISASVIMDYTVEYSELSVGFLTIAITISCMMYYIWLHLQFVRAHERELQAEHRIRIMMTQIQPHFLFNTLTAIRALCVKDPDAAVHTIGLFSTYLRQNLQSLDKAGLIPLSKELEHTRVYTEIETIRFPNISIEYDIRDNECCVPALTVQPLVENAIRHGVRSKEKGIVKISAYREDNSHLIVIEDNGIGFDVHKTDDTDDLHIGISNVRERIEKMCGGTVEIDSRPGEGTKVLMRIPVSEE